MRGSKLQGRRGFSLIEILISASLVAIAAMAGVAYVTRGTQHADWARDRVFARQKALSILAEMRSFVEGGGGEVAADLDGFDDGLAYEAALTIQPDPNDPGAFLAPEHAVSGNIHDNDAWRWHRQISVRRFPGAETRDLRICTVKMFRMRRGDAFPGEQMAEVSSVIKTVGDAFPTTQVYDLYLMAMDNVPGWWVYMDAIQPFIEATLTDLESRNPGLKFRTHWITKTGFGRDQEYAPYTNEVRDSRADTPWTYVYPGRMPSGFAAARYYVPGRMTARVNLDGVATPHFVNDLAAQETYTDVNGNGRRDPGETFVDANGNGVWDEGNPAPYAMADMHNHCMRWPAADKLHDARVAAGLDDEHSPTFRLLLDRMIASPARYHNAILINLHGELLPMPPVRNYSDAAKAPEFKPGWRAVTHPELLRPRRTLNNASATDDLRWRVYAYKTEFDGTAGAETIMTQQEPLLDLDKNGVHDTGEPFEDWNGDGIWSNDSACISLSTPGDFTSLPNAPSNPSIRIQRLPGGIDADGDTTADPYVDWSNAPHYPEAYVDGNNNGRRDVADHYLDLDGNGQRDPWDPYTDQGGDGGFTLNTETLKDENGNGTWDPDTVEEAFTDANNNGKWDAAEPYWDVNNNGYYDPPVASWQPWDPAIHDHDNPTSVQNYVAINGEPFMDLDGDSTWDDAESFYDANQNGTRDGGFKRGEMWYTIKYDNTTKHTNIFLFGTPLETPYVSSSQRGLPTDGRLYDLDYVPCPTPSSPTDADPFALDLYAAGNVQKNTARWIVEIPKASAKKRYESKPGHNDGDALDRILTMETRIGDDLTTGAKWPAWNHPQNLSVAYSYFYLDKNMVPFSERYQFMGDPRHCPYADLSQNGTNFPNGYNWYFDNFNNGNTPLSPWHAFDPLRLKDAWKGERGGSHDVPRLLSYLRTALAKTEAVYTTLTGFSYYYMSVGGDVGYDSANGFPDSIPMDGKPFGISGNVYEHTITTGNGASTNAIKGSLKYVRSNDGNGSGIRGGGYWWSKPWLGELFQDAAYATQWKVNGNLTANTGSNTLEYRLIRRGDITGSQQPRGTTMKKVYARLKEEGCTSVFNIGTSNSTFHHQFKSGQTGTLTEDGPQLANNYNFPIPTTTAISRPFGLATNGSGGVGDEFSYTTEYPRFSAQMVRKFFNHQAGQTGSGIVRLQEPGANPRGAYIIVNGLDRTTESGSAFIARFSMLSLIHTFFAAGKNDPNRIRQLPRVEIKHPRLETELQDPSVIPVTWASEWRRWDGMKYTESYADDHAEDETALFHVPMYSDDGGKSWHHMMDDSVANPGTMPLVSGTNDPDLTKVLQDANQGVGTAGNEVYNWITPKMKFPQGSYLIRVDTYRGGEVLHYSQHVEKIYVNR